MPVSRSHSVSLAVPTGHCKSLAITKLVIATRKSLYLCMNVAIHRPSVYGACAYVFVDDHFHLEMIVKINVIILDEAS